MKERKPLNHTGSVTLETERLILRKTQLSDAEQMFNNWASDLEVTKYLLWQTHESIEETKRVLSIWDEKNDDLTYYHWGIVLKENNEIIGTCGNFGIHEHHYSTELGYCMSRKYWGQGYMSEAVNAMIKHFFEVVGLNRISARYHPDNIGSGKVMQKCKMIYEGIHRKEHYNNKFCEYYDLIIYAILKDDYVK